MTGNPVPCPEIAQDASGGDYGEGMKERMYQLAASLSAPTIVELGTRTGNSLRIWAAAVATGGGMVYSIDCRMMPLDADGRPWRPPPHTVLIVASTQHVEWQAPIDLLYIDADHTTTGCRADLEHFWPWVRPGGHLLMHDIANEGHVRDLFLPVVVAHARAQSCAFEVWPNQCGMAHFVKGESP